MHRTEIERLFLATMCFNTSLVQFLPPYHIYISNVGLMAKLIDFKNLLSKLPDFFLF